MTTNSTDQNTNIEFLKNSTNTGLMYLIQCTNLLPPDEGKRAGDDA